VTVAARRRDREVLEAAIKVFHAHGYADGTMNQVADELGLAKGSLYHYARTKEDLLFRLLEDAHAHVEAILAAAAARADLPPLERLALYVRGQLEFGVDNLPLVSVCNRDLRHLDDPRLRGLMLRLQDHHAWAVEMIRLAQERGEAMPGVAPELLANCVFGAFIWVYRWYRPEHADRRRAVVDGVTRYALAGVARP
jgi:AcrR family transcriptional regulator